MFYYIYFLLYQKITQKTLFSTKLFKQGQFFLDKFLKLVCSDNCIKNNFMISDSILVNETKTLFKE